MAKRKARRGRGKSKGNSFERRLCKLLSEWITHGERDDIFWRSATSGGRATVRRKQNRSTANSDGDISAIDPIGMPMTENVCIEAKVGYPKASLQDILDREKSLYREWIHQAAAADKHWMVVVKRHSSDIVVIAPAYLFKPLLHKKAILIELNDPKDKLVRKLIAFRFDDFLKITPEDFLKWLSKI